jgi:hypothetical protein
MGRFEVSGGCVGGDALFDVIVTKGVLIVKSLGAVSGFQIEMPLGIL